MEDKPTTDQQSKRNGVLEARNAGPDGASRFVSRRIMAVSAALILWMPVFILATFAIHGFFTHAPLPILLYPVILRMLWPASAAGGVFLFFPARAARTLHRPIGIVSLGMVLLVIVGALASGKEVMRLDLNRLTQAGDVVLAVTSALVVLCMFALNVFSILLTMRFFRKQRS